MNIIVILPGLCELNDNLYFFIELQKKGHNVKVFTSRSKELKGVGYLPDYDNYDMVEVFRVVNNIYDSKEVKKLIDFVKKTVNKEQVDIIFCGTWYLLKIAMHLGKYYNAKIILLLEFFINSKRLIGRKRYYLGLNLLVKPSAWVVRKYILRSADKIIVSAFTEENEIKRRYVLNSKIVIIPWCNHIPNYKILNLGYGNRLDQAIFAGELSEITINKNFVKVVESLIINRIITKVVIIGYGPKEYIIQHLKKKYPDNIYYLGTLSRHEVLKEIERSKLAINTTESGGWGFIGECWALGTPILYVKNHYDFNDKVDSIFFDVNSKETICYLNELLRDESKYILMQKLMHERYLKNHTAESTSEKFLKVLNSL